MANVTVEKIINTAKSLVGKDAGSGCDIMKWYGGFSTAINTVACCCAGQMYLFNKAGALSMIPGGKTASCGQLALNFYNAGQLYKPSEIKVGDLVIFSWSGAATTYNSKLVAAGYKSFDHVELCLAVGNTTITTGGFNNGGTECDDFQIKTRSKSNISACCRPKYATSTSTTTNTTSTTTSSTTTAIPDVTYRVRAGGTWYPAVKNFADYAGVVGKAITDVAIKVSKGTVKYRVHVKGGSWLPYVTGYNTSDSINGYAGNGKAIDAIEVYYTTPSDLKSSLGYYLRAKYRVSPLNGSYYSYQYDNEKTNGQDGYAGAIGTSIDRLQIILSR